MAKVLIYKTTTCPYCKMETEYLKSKGIEFEEIYVDNDPKAAEEMIRRSGQMGVPFTIIESDDGKTVNILGFDRPALDKALGL